MILRALFDYYQRKKEDLPPFGYELNDRIPFTIVLDEQGNFVDWEDNRLGEEKNKRSRPFFVPQSQKRPGTKGWQTAFLLWDHIGYVLGHDSEDPELAKKQHQSFLARLEQTFPNPVSDTGIFAVKEFLKRGNFNKLYKHPAWEDIKKKPFNITFRLQSDPQNLICQRESVQKVVAAMESQNIAGRGRCLVTGEISSISRLHTAIKGVDGAQTVGADIVAFNFGSVCSYGKTFHDRGANAPVSEYAMFAYTTALNYLLRVSSRQKLLVGKDTFVFWAEKPNLTEELIADWLEPEPDDPARGVAAVAALCKAPQTGVRPFEDDYTRFFVLGLAPNNARLAVRLWHVNTVRELAANIRQHFDDLAIIRSPYDLEFLPLKRLLKATAAQSESKNISPLLTGEVLRAILTRTPYPQTLLITTLQRIRAEQSKRDKNGRSVLNVTYERAALLKAVLTRNNRFNNFREQEIIVSLDIENSNIGYRLGRLFAVLERAQELASPGLNATIRDRFYGAASATPVTAFPYLLNKLAPHHLNKLTAGQKIWLENLIGQILEAVTQFPPHLNLDDQGRFAIGYYHQRQEFFTKKSTDNQTIDQGAPDHD